MVLLFLHDGAQYHIYTRQLLRRNNHLCIGDDNGWNAARISNERILYAIHLDGWKTQTHTVKLGSRQMIEILVHIKHMNL